MNVKPWRAARVIAVTASVALVCWMLWPWPWALILLAGALGRMCQEGVRRG